MTESKRCEERLPEAARSDMRQRAGTRREKNGWREVLITPIRPANATRATRQRTAVTTFSLCAHSVLGGQMSSAPARQPKAVTTTEGDRRECAVDFWRFTASPLRVSSISEKTPIAKRVQEEHPQNTEWRRWPQTFPFAVDGFCEEKRSTAQI